MERFLENFDPTIIIYVIAAIFWVFSKSGGNKKRALRRVEQMRREREQAAQTQTNKREAYQPKRNTGLEDLETFLRGLSGEQQAQTPSTPPPLPPQKKIVQPPPQPPEPVVPPLPLSRVVDEAMDSYDIGELDMEASFKQIDDIKEAEELTIAGIDDEVKKQALQTVRSMMVDLSSSTISVPRIPLHNIRAVQTQTSRPNLDDKKRFKQALVSSIILSPPKALRQNPFTEIS